MAQSPVLDTSIIKDLSNHIYEKRKATAFQIESLTKSALARNDSQTIYNIVKELGELTNGSTNSARMGAITALGSVSVALGSFAIAYFLDDIIKPIFSTFRDTDARVRYYACESLYNIAKIARGEILLYFNEIFDVLCILVTDSESSVKNAADILDRLIKDIVSAKATNYVSILQQQNDLKSGDADDIRSHIVDESGTAIQVNQLQDTQKAFSLPKFIPSLLERMYTTDPFAKKFLISWLELFDDIPSLELITFLPNFLEPLIKFLRNNAPSDVRIETQNILNVFLKEVKSIHRVKYEVKERQLIKEKRTEALKDEKEVTTQLDENTKPQADDTDEISLEVKDITLKEKEESDEASIQLEDTKEHDQTPEADGEKEDHIDDGLGGDLEDEFLEGQNIFIDYQKIIVILLSLLKTDRQEYLSTDTHEISLEVQFIVLRWLQEIIQISPISFTNYFPDCVTITMQNVASADNNKDFELRNQFLKFNLALQSFFIKLNDVANTQRQQEKEQEKAEKEREKEKEKDKDKEKEKEKDKETKVKDETNVANKEDKNIPPEDYQDETKEESKDQTDIKIDENVILGLNKEVYEEFIEFQLTKTLHKIMRECLSSSNELARITLLDWLIFLYSREPKSFVDLEGEGDTFDLTALLQSATDSSNEVILKVLQLLSKISETNQDFFKDFMVKLIIFFEREVQDINLDSPNPNTRNYGPSTTLTRSKVEFIIRKLCVTLDSEKIFKTISEVLGSLENVNLEFLNMIIVTLNNILLTTPELTSFRKKLKNLDVYKMEDWLLFSTLFQSWCHNSASALSLCLLTANYDLAFLIIKSLSELEVTFQLLTQLDILVQLLESPIFLKLRLLLLEPEKNPYLYKTLYGLLMILPQSSTYTTLHNRLSSVSSVNNLNPNLLSGGQLTTPVSTPGPSLNTANASSSVSQQLSIKRKRVYEMLDRYNRVQESHEGHHLTRKLRESATSSLYQTDDANYHRNLNNKPVDALSQSRSDRLLSYGSNQLEKKDYFANIDNMNEKPGKRVGSGRFGLNRLSGN